MARAASAAPPVPSSRPCSKGSSVRRCCRGPPSTRRACGGSSGPAAELEAHPAAAAPPGRRPRARRAAAGAARRHIGPARGAGPPPRAPAHSKARHRGPQWQLAPPRPAGPRRPPRAPGALRAAAAPGPAEKLPAEASPAPCSERAAAAKRPPGAGGEKSERPMKGFAGLPLAPPSGAEPAAGAVPAAAAAAAPGSSMTTVIAKGGVPVDKLFPRKDQYHVYQQDGEVWDCMLNQTNVGANNNKFYVIQLLEKDSGGGFLVWNRWGRVGAAGQTQEQACHDVGSAKSTFQAKFQSKTKNHWQNRKDFKAVTGHYTYIEVDYGTAGAAASQPSQDAKDVPPSKLPPTVQRLMSLICDTNMMKQAMMEIGYDAKKMPLGKISKKMIKEGFEALQVIAAELDKKKPNQVVIGDASSRFYSVIPHDFGFQHMSNFIIQTKERLEEKLKMVEALQDIEVAHRLLEDDKGKPDKHPADVHYEKLKTELVPVAEASKDWKLVEGYMQNTHAATHSSYKLKLKSLFAVEREGEAERFKKFEAAKNRQLLWHGSRLTNWCGILSQGLRIAPPEAPVTGYMFGKGVYFADMVSKSSNYCFASKSNSAGIMLLAEVALGDMNKLLAADLKADQLPEGKLSTKGCGKTAPDAAQATTWGKGVTVPCGTVKDVSEEVQGSSLMYNEYIVYDVSQIRTRFLMEVEFQYK
uniref:Poly [ADP-ribose] polymerase n=1 Tax=Lingulaulax polyedra TaxID=160621 RepID=A0A516AGD1_LINPO|nr:poly [ADP-ribose] polymerase 2 [Lingulodinium polyedra]